MVLGMVLFAVFVKRSSGMKTVCLLIRSSNGTRKCNNPLAHHSWISDYSSKEVQMNAPSAAALVVCADS